MLVDMQVTSKCNYTCPMCHYHGESYNGKYFSERPELKQEMSLSQVQETLERLKDSEVSIIDLTPNGEFFTYKNWREVLQLVSDYKFKITITTNGGLLEEKDIKEVVAFGVDFISVSVDSVNYDTYKIVRRPASKKAFENAIHAPILFKQYGDSRVSAGGGALYVQVGYTNQLNNAIEAKKEVEDLLAFYQPHKLNQISVAEMFIATKEGVSYKDYKDTPSYVVGTCKSYGANYIITPDGSVFGCCAEFFLFPKLKDKIPNIFKKSFDECKQQSDDLYLHNPIFIDYCKHCSLYAINNEKVLERKFIHNGYFAMQYATQTRYFVIPEYFNGLREDILLFMYEKGYAGEIKKFVQEKASQSPA